MENRIFMCNTLMVSNKSAINIVIGVKFWTLVLV